MTASRGSRTAATVIAGVLLLGASPGLVACGVVEQINRIVPADPDGTLDRVTGGVLRVGITPFRDRVVIDGEPSGADIRLIEAFAASIDARIDWVEGSEEWLTRALERDRLDLVVGGITEETPWMDRAGMTRPYTEVTTGDGSTVGLVMLTPMGENAFLSALERFLTAEGDDT